MNGMRQLIGIAGAAVLAAASFSSASAAETAAAGTLAVRSAIVRYDDLSMDTAVGVQTLYARLKSAAKRVCGPADPALRAMLEQRACEAGALAEAIERSGNAELAALHAAERAPTRVAPRIASLR